MNYSKIQGYNEYQQQDHNKKYVLAYGGGVNSSALFFYLLEKNKPLDLVIYADTGAESKETYEAFNRMNTECIKRNIPIIGVSKNQPLVTYYIENKAVPSMMKRDCTSKFKISVMRRALRSQFGKQTQFVQYIGIARDEIHRVTESDVKYVTLCFPFVYDEITRQGNKDILKKYKFKAEKSGCMGCPFQKKTGFIKLLRENPTEFAKWELMEKTGSRYPEITLNPAFKLESIRLTYKNTLSDFIDLDNEDTGLCNNTIGGCFL